jgi:ribose transport system permease protein
MWFIRPLSHGAFASCLPADTPTCPSCGVLVLGSFASCILGNWIGLPGVVIGGLAVGFILIFINFLIFTYTGIPSWIAGISLAMIYEAIGFYLKIADKTKPLVTTALAREYRLLGQLPWSLVFLFVGLVVVYFIYNRTTIGLNIRALGGNKDVASKLGINVNKTLLCVGVISGVTDRIGLLPAAELRRADNSENRLTSINLIFFSRLQFTCLRRSSRSG